MSVSREHLIAGSKSVAREAILRALPPALAIIPVSMLFGILAVRADWDLIQILAASLFGFTGSGQFALLPLTESGAGFMTMLLLCASINSRYLPISLTTHSRLPKSFLERISVAHMLGDEAYATERDSDSINTISRVRVIIFLTWVVSGVVGGLLGQAIPNDWIGEDIYLGFPASVVLVYLSVVQLKVRMRGVYRLQVILVMVCCMLTIFFIYVLGPVYFWLPGVAVTTIVLYLWGKK
ncbi:AzlC family ABC transporter permease [Litoribacillus peritrichatus]|uniref:Branched-chain amino acid ABC transporter permease n=1 Tax=Litoribacillus peritrichatus TaxID=718191 RepID=A0ABP7N7G9_9GAMM